MSADPLAWNAHRFDIEVERRADGSALLHPITVLGPYPERVTDQLEHWAAIAPDRTFVARRAADGAWRGLTYARTLERVRAIGGGLTRLPLSPERPLAILSGNSVEHLLLALAAMHVGIPYCPVCPAYAQSGSDLAKLRYVMQLLTPGAIALDASGFEHAVGATAPRDATVIALSDLGRLVADNAEGAEAHHARVSADSIAKFLLTSGSTGQPKAVITTHRMLCSNQIMLRAAVPFVVDEPPVIVDWLPWNHTYGGSHNVGLVLFNGGSLFIDDGRPTPGAFEHTVRNLSEISPTVYFNVPRGFDMLAQRMEQDPTLRARFYQRLRACFFAGAGLAQHTWDALDRHAVAERGGRVPILSGLGATETAPSVTFTTPETDRAGAIGLPAPGAVVKLAPVGGKLELRCRGPHVMPGYWRAPEQSAAAFDEEGFYRLGDAVRLLDPADPRRGLFFDGRIAEDFKLSSGTWVSVGPLRQSLLAALAPLAADLAIAGLNREYLTLLVLPDVEACRTALDSTARSLSQPELARDSRLLQQLRERLQGHARAQLGSASRVRRAAVIGEPPSLDRGEITDKGTINQRRLLERWAGLVDQLYERTPPPFIVCVED